MVMVDAQTVKGARYGPTFHQAGGRGGRTIGTKRTLLVEICGLPVAASACSARPHDVVAARELLHERIDTLPRLRAIVGDRAYRGLEARRAQEGRARHQSAAGGCERLCPDPTALPDREHIRPARALAQARAKSRSRYPGTAGEAMGAPFGQGRMVDQMDGEAYVTSASAITPG
jgi:hypothetical protein